MVDPDESEGRITAEQLPANPDDLLSYRRRDDPSGLVA
jgi:hypothetical protein